jgi:hypothetical protein
VVFAVKALCGGDGVRGGPLVVGSLHVFNVYWMQGKLVTDWELARHSTRTEFRSRSEGGVKEIHISNWMKNSR